MPRNPISPRARAEKVEASARALPALIAAAIDAQDRGLPAEKVHALWAVVEEHGAVVHRQGRLLAGKSKGG